MPDIVLDSSIALAWCFIEEATDATTAILDGLEIQGALRNAIVPSLWHMEIANILTLSLKKKRIDDAGLSKFLRLVSKLPIVTDIETAERALKDTLVLSRHCELTAYDAAYLELAQRLAIPLATKDAQLIEAAKKLKVSLLEG